MNNPLAPPSLLSAAVNPAAVPSATALEIRRRIRALLDACPREGGNPEHCQLHRHRFWNGDEKEVWLDTLPPWVLGEFLRNHARCMHLHPHPTPPPSGATP